MVKHPPAMWETRVRSLDWEDPLEKETATHSSTLAWKILWTEEPGRLQSMESQRVRHNWTTSLYFIEGYLDSWVRKICWRRYRLPTPVFLGFPGGSASKKICLQCRRLGFDPWGGTIPWRRERLPTPVFWPRKFHGLYCPWGHKELDTTEWLSLHFT